MATNHQTVTFKDFRSSQEIRWCAGCGDYGILVAVQKAMAESKIPKEDFVIVSGIGCSSRFPYYINTYGFHGIHGRGSAIASGVKCGNKDLKVIQVTGDGDALAIGGNHFIHAIRRNVDISILLFNNEIYGLTKGQYSPTSRMGTITKTSPFGTIEHPFQPAELTIGSMGKFFARSVDVNIPLTKDVVLESIKYKGTAVVEILQNCLIFNDKIHKAFASKENRKNNFIELMHGEKMIFGENNDRGLIINENGKLEIVNLKQFGVNIRDILTHDAHEPNPFLHLQLANMQYPEMPVALGVIRKVDATTYDEAMEKQITTIENQSKINSMDELLNSGYTWNVE